MAKSLIIFLLNENLLFYAFYRPNSLIYDSKQFAPFVIVLFNLFIV